MHSMEEWHNLQIRNIKLLLVPIIVSSIIIVSHIN